MDVIEAISGRRSIREYQSQAVDEKTIHRLIDAAIAAPNAPAAAVPRRVPEIRWIG